MSHGVPVDSSMPASSTRTMWSLAMREPTRASSRKRSRSRGFAAKLAWSTFSATRRPVVPCSTSYTAPMPPSPSVRMTRYFPANNTPSVNMGAVDIRNPKRRERGARPGR